MSEVMIEIRIDEITVIKDGRTWKDMSTGMVGVDDKWKRRTIYTQLLPDGEIDIRKTIRVINGGDV